MGANVSCATRVAPIQSNYMRTYNVFLGGSCNPTTWRKDIAIPRLQKAKLTFYNPQVDDWSPELVDIEARAKENADILLFVIDDQTRAVASIAEAAYYIGTGRKVVLVVQKFVGYESVYSIHPNEFKDLNRGRTYLEDFAKRHNVPLCDSVESAVDMCVTKSS